MIEVTLLSIPQIDWKSYLIKTNQYLGRSPTKGLDVANQRVGDLRAFVVSLTEILEPGQKPNQVMFNPNPILRHLYFSFLINGDIDILCDAFQKANLSILIAKSPDRLKTAILTATLWDWYQAIIYRTSDTEQTEIRRFYDTILLIFEGLGLGELWRNKEKLMLIDSTFTLRDL